LENIFAGFYLFKKNTVNRWASVVFQIRKLNQYKCSQNNIQKGVKNIETNTGTNTFFFNTI